MASIAAASGVEALGLISLIVSSARNATMHRRNCEQLAEHVKVIGNLLEQLKSTDLMALPAIREPLDGMEEALKRALELVKSCREKSCLYMLAMGWSVVYQFRQVQDEIDRYLRLVPLISLVHEFCLQNMKEGLKVIEEDQREYSLDGKDVEAQSVILKPDRTKKDAAILEKSLSCKYPELGFYQALQEEKEKLHVELQRSRTLNDTKQCRIIEHLIDVTENVVNVLPGKKVNKLLVNEPTYVISGYMSNAKASRGALGLKPDEDQGLSEWQVDLFDCCREPCLSLKACIYPCGIFSRIANAVSGGKICKINVEHFEWSCHKNMYRYEHHPLPKWLISQLLLLKKFTAREKAINDLMAYSLLCGCCCYSCCVRTKLRKNFNIEGGVCDDFLTHLVCFCCAMVQEWRELEVRGFAGCQGRKMIPPPYQYMKP